MYKAGSRRSGQSTKNLEHFDEFDEVIKFQSLIYKIDFKETRRWLEDSQCTCPIWNKNDYCKHITGIARKENNNLKRSTHSYYLSTISYLIKLNFS